MNEVRAVAPTRVDFAGGTLDLWPIHCVLGPCSTINMAVDLHAEVAVSWASTGNYEFACADQNTAIKGDWHRVTTSTETLLVSRFVRALWNPEWGPIRVRTNARSPAGAGLGGSSALAIALAGALVRARQPLSQAEELDERDLVTLASNVEASIIGIPTGIQDYWGAVRGGLNVIRFPETGADVTTHPVAEVAHLTDRLVLCFSGKSRASARNNWDIFRAVFDKDERVRASLQAIGRAAMDCAAALESERWGDFLDASQREWSERERLWPDIHTEETRSLRDAAAGAGAFFSRVCGAGGGGVMAIFTEPEQRAGVIRALQAKGGQILEAAPAVHGLSITGRL